MKLKEKIRDINNKFEKKIISTRFLIDPNELEYNSFILVCSISLVIIGTTFAPFFNTTIMIIFSLFSGFLLIVMFTLFISYIDRIYYSEDLRRRKLEFYCKICKRYKRTRKVLLSLYNGYSTYKLLCGHKYYIKVVYIEEYCKICSSKLHFGNYPENFPDDYKICCQCLNTAKYIYSNKKIIFWGFGKKNRYIKFKEKFDRLFLIKRND